MKREEATTLAKSALDELASALREGQSDTLVSYLEMLSRFHHYSFQNCMLIALQSPGARFVAGFRRWKQLGRQVKKGERGIGILAPLVYRNDNDGEEPGDNNQDRRVLRGFKVVHVFDVSQTEGEELPELARITGDPGEKTARLEALIRSHGIELEYAPIPRGRGMSEGGKITLVPDLEPAERFAILAHEVAHLCGEHSYVKPMNLFRWRWSYSDVG
jgi:antirestriction protein ArdC